jgi:hypothetical protein
MAFTPLSKYVTTGLVPQSQILITDTRTLTYEQDTFALVCLVGGGGSGAVWHRGNNATDFKVGCTGANGGGVGISLVRFLASETYTIACGDGIAGLSKSGTTEQYQDGATGNDTTMTSTAPGWLTITAKGGYGGKYSRALETTTDATDLVNTVQEGVNAAVNADIVFGPGYGGPITINQHNANFNRNFATGGGAANLYGAPQAYVSGGLIDLENTLGGTATQNRDYSIATGGGGTGGRGGAALLWGRDVGTVLRGVTGGGGSQANGDNLVAFNSGNTLDRDGGLGGLLQQASILGFTGDGGDGVDSSAGSVTFDIPGSGGGQGGYWADSNHNSTDIPPAGGFGGGGAGMVVGALNTPYQYAAGDGGYGAGGGGACASAEQNTSNSGQATTSGGSAGGFAIVVVMTNFGKARF